MTGFGLDGFEGRIECPHCGSTDCAGLRHETTNDLVDGKVRTLSFLVCCTTGKEVNERELVESALAHGHRRIR